MEAKHGKDCYEAVPTLINLAGLPEGDAWGAERRSPPP